MKWYESPPACQRAALACKIVDWARASSIKLDTLVLCRFKLSYGHSDFYGGDGVSASDHISFGIGPEAGGVRPQYRSL